MIICRWWGRRPGRSRRRSSGPNCFVLLRYSSTTGRDGQPKVKKAIRHPYWTLLDCRCGVIRPQARRPIQLPSPTPRVQKTVPSQIWYQNLQWSAKPLPGQGGGAWEARKRGTPKLNVNLQQAEVAKGETKWKFYLIMFYCKNKLIYA